MLLSNRQQQWGLILNLNQPSWAMCSTTCSNSMVPPSSLNPGHAWIGWNHYRFICPQAKWERGHDVTCGLSHWSQGRGSHGLSRDQSRIGRPPDNTQLYTRNTWLWSQETQPHWRREQMYHNKKEAQAKFNEYRETQGSHDEVYTDGSKMNKRVWAAAIIKHHFQSGETTCHRLSKRLPDNNIIFAAEATVITLALNFYRYMGPVHHDVVVYSEPLYLPYHEPPLVIEGQKHTCSFLLDTDPLWHRRKWKSRPASKRDAWPWHIPTGKCPPCRFEAIGQLLNPTAGSNQVGCDFIQYMVRIWP